MSTERTTDCCTTTPAIQPEGYKETGKVLEIPTPDGPLKFYESAKDLKNEAVAVLLYYDVFGDIPGGNLRQQSDRISQALGVRVVTPHFFGPDVVFKGDLSTEEGRSTLWPWLGEHAPPEKVIIRTELIVSQLKQDGAKKIIAVGFCWGGMQVIELATRKNLFVAAASVHGKNFAPSAAERLVIPFANYASENEGEHTREFVEALPQDVDGVKVKDAYEFKLFGDVPHGFAAARGDWKNNETHRKRAEEVIDDFVEFAKKHV